MVETAKLIKEKSCCSIKVRTCVNRIRHENALKEYESIAWPIVSLEGLFITLIIDEKINRDVAIFDILGAYIYADMPREK